jgi:ectoine hydroxylase-related dioxygenase (phytanoyl-CoA dioxygenase family)
MVETHVTDADVTAFRENGYWVGPRLWDADQLSGIRGSVERILAGDYATGVAPSVVGWSASGLLARLGSDEEAGSLVRGMLRKIDNCHICDMSLRAITDDRRLTAAAKSLLGVSRIRLWQDKIFSKPPSEASPLNCVDWHQDYHWWRCVDRPELLIVWIPLQDVDEGNGALQVIRGSHAWGWRPEFVYFADFDQLRQLEGIRRAAPDARLEAVTVPVRAGHPLFLNCLTIHCSALNTAHEPRLAYVVNYQSADCRWRSAPDTDRLHFAPAEMRRLGRHAGDCFIGPLWPDLD